MRCYYALWIPTLVELLPRILNANPDTVELKDVDGLSPCTLRCSVDVAKKNVMLSYTLGDLGEEKHLNFIHVESSRSGLIVYELNFTGQSDALIQNLDGQMHHSIYHYIKGIFHEHNFHDEESDSLLEAYASYSLISLSDSKTVKEINNHYLGLYRQKLDSSYLTLSGQYALLQNVVNERKDYAEGLEKVKKLKDSCSRVMGEASYATALLRMSRFTVKNVVYNELNQRLLSLELLRSKISDAYSLINNDYSNRLGRKGIWVGSLGIVLTLVLEFSHCVRDNSYDRDVELRRSAELRRLVSRADSLSAVNQSIIDKINKND